MANTGTVQVNIQTLNDGTTAVSATATGSATTTFTECVEGILLITCAAVSGSGIFTPLLSGSTDGVTYAALTATTGTALVNTSATGRVQYRYKQLPRYLRLDYTKVSGTSVTVVATFVGLVPTDSANATSV